MSLDHDQDVVSIDAATTDATEVADAVVSEARARRTALSVAAKAHRVPIADAARHEPWPSPLRPGPRARDGPRRRPTRLAARGRQRLRRPRDGARGHRPWRGRPALQRRAGDQPARVRQRRRRRLPERSRRPALHDRGRPQGGWRRLTGRRGQRRLRQPRGHLRRLRRAGRDRPDRDDRHPGHGPEAADVHGALVLRRGPVPVPERVLGRHPDGVRDRLRQCGRRRRPRAHPRLRGEDLGPVRPEPERGAERVPRRHHRRDRRPPQSSVHRERRRLGGGGGPPRRRDLPQHAGPDAQRLPRPDDQPVLREHGPVSKARTACTRTAVWATRPPT